MEAEIREVLASSVSEPDEDVTEAEFDETLARIQREFRNYVPEGRPLVDEFLAERRRMWGEE